MALSKRARRRLILLSAVIVAIVGSVFAAKQLLEWRRAKAIEEARSSGFAAYAAADYATVLASLGPLIRQSADDLELVRAVAFSRLRVEEADGGHLSGAAALLQRVVELDPSDVEAHRELMRIYPKLGFLRETLDASDAILEASPGDSEAMEARVQVLAAMGRWTEASDLATSLVVADPDSQRWKQLQVSTALAGGAEIDEVIALAAEWPPSSFEDGLDELVLAALVAISGESERASELAQSAVARGAGNGDRLAAMLSILGDLARVEDADALIRGFASEGDPGDAAFAVVASDWALGAGRADFLRERFEAAPEGSDARIEYAIPLALMSLAGGGRNRDRWIDAIEQANPTRNEAILAREAILAIHRGREQGDRKAFDQVIERGRRSGAALPELLAAAIAAASLNDAVSMKRFALAADARQRTLLGSLLLVDAQVRSGEAAAAIDTATGLVARYPDRIDPLIVLLTMWADAGALSSEQLDRIRRTTASPTPFELANRLVDAVGMIPAVAVAYTAAAIGQGRPEAIEDAVVALLTSDPPAIDAMLRTHIRISDVAPNLAAQLQDRLVEVAPSNPRVLAITVEVDAQAAALVNRLREVLPLDHAEDSVREEAWLAAFTRVQALTGEDFRAMAEEALDSCPESLSISDRVLYDPRAWGDAEFSRRIVDRVTALRGPESRQSRLAEANWVLQHNRDAPDARGASIVSLNELWLSDPGSFAVGATLLRLMIADAAADPQSAIRLGRQLIASRPDAVELYPIVVSLLQSQGMLADAERMLVEFEAIDRDGTLSARQRAAVSVQQGNLDELVRSLARLSSRTGDAEDAISLGIAREATGDLVGAEQAYREALSDEQTAAEAIVRLGTVLRRAGRLGDFEQVLREQGDVLSELQRDLSLAEIQFSGGDQRGAIARLSAAAARNPEEPAAWRALAKACIAAGDSKAAGDAAVRGLLLDPESPEFQSIAMAAAIEDGAWAEAAMLRGEFVGRLPAVVVEGTRLLRAARTGSGRLAPDGSLLRASRELCSRFGDSPNSWRVAAALHQAAGQAAESRAIADAAARRFPMAPDPVEWQISAVTALGDLDQASSLCIEWRRRSFPEVRRVDEAQAAIELARKRPDSALPLLKRHRDLIVKDATVRPGPYRALLASMMMTGDVRGAAELERANLVASEISRATWATIASFASYQQGLEAMSILESVSPPDPLGRGQMVARWVAFHERHPDGIGLERARALLPRSMGPLADFDSRIATIARSDVERAAGDAEAARASLQSVIDSYPSNIQVRAKALGGLSGPEQQALFREIEPLLYARNNLAMLLVEQDRSLDEALAMVEQCVEIVPGNPELCDTEAQVLLKLGRLSEAEQSALVAIRAYPQSASVLLTGAEILAASGRVEDARQLLQRIRDIVSREPWPSQQVEGRLDRVAAAIDSAP